MRRALILSIVALCLVCAPPAVAGSPTDDLARAQADYARGAYDETARTVAPLLYPRPLLAAGRDIDTAHYLLAMSYFFLGDRDMAAREFTALLFGNPGFELDAAVEDPGAYAFFVEVKRENAGKLEEIRRAQREAAERRRSREVLILREHHDTPAWANWMPLGLTQLGRGQTAWGAAFLGTQVAGGGLSLATFGWQLLKYGLPPKAPSDPDERAQINRVQVVQIVSGGVFWASWAFSVLHAYQTQPPSVVETRTVKPLALPGPIAVPYAGAGQAGVVFTWEY